MKYLKLRKANKKNYLILTERKISNKTFKENF